MLCAYFTQYYILKILHHMTGTRLKYWKDFIFFYLAVGMEWNITARIRNSIPEIYTYKLIFLIKIKRCYPTNFYHKSYKTTLLCTTVKPVVTTCYRYVPSQIQLPLVMTQSITSIFTDTRIIFWLNKASDKSEWIFAFSVQYFSTI